MKNSSNSPAVSPPPPIRHVLAHFRARQLNAAQATDRHGLSRSRFCEIYANYLQACAHHRQDLWVTGVSGSDHAPDWSESVTALLRVDWPSGIVQELRDVLANQALTVTEPVRLVTTMPGEFEIRS